MDEKSVVKVIERFCQDQIAKGKRKQTIDKYMRIINEFVQWINQNEGSLRQLTSVDLQQFIYHLEQKGNCAATIENKFAALSVFVKFLGFQEILRHIWRPETRKIHHIAPKFLERNERNRLLREVERSANLRNIAIVYLLLYTGLRVSELVALNQEDITVTEQSGSVKVRKGQRNVARQVPLPPEARSALYAYLRTREDDDPALFLSNYKKRITIRSVQRVLEKYGVCPHQLRHTYCRELVCSGVDIATVAALVGLSDINLTRRYSKPSEQELEQAIEKVFDSFI
ncbi:tyrosine-type recombinase/integrase [Laceyella putida]|uniref:Tyrosine-type recombinase/integrase n=1 Tax=Laceyella putida TaxID=110101 RepID=A0ABW2RHP0_9BACL